MDNIITTLRRIKIKTIGAIGRIRRKLNKIQNFMSPIKFSRFYILWFFIKAFVYSILVKSKYGLFVLCHFLFVLILELYLIFALYFGLLFGYFLCSDCQLLCVKIRTRYFVNLFLSYLLFCCSFCFFFFQGSYLIEIVNRVKVSQC